MTRCVFCAFAGQEVGIKEVEDGIWVVTFLDYDLGYFDAGGKRVGPAGFMSHILCATFRFASGNPSDCAIWLYRKTGGIKVLR